MSVRQAAFLGSPLGPVTVWLMEFGHVYYSKNECLLWSRPQPYKQYCLYCSVGYILPSRTSIMEPLGFRAGHWCLFSPSQSVQHCLALWMLASRKKCFLVSSRWVPRHPTTEECAIFTESVLPTTFEVWLRTMVISCLKDKICKQMGGTAKIILGEITEAPKDKCYMFFPYVDAFFITSMFASVVTLASHFWYCQFFFCLPLLFGCFVLFREHVSLFQIGLERSM